MIDNQTLATALNALAVLAADRKKVKSSDFQAKLFGAAVNIAGELQDRGAELDTVVIRDAEQRSAEWTLPVITGRGAMEDVRFVINARDLIG